MTHDKIMSEITARAKHLPTDIFGVHVDEFSRKDLLRIIVWLGGRLSMAEQALKVEVPDEVAEAEEDASL